MGWVYQWRGVLLALTLSILGHVWVGFVWSAPVVPPTLLSMSDASSPVVMPLVVRVRWISVASDAVAVAPQPTSTTPPEQPTTATPEPETPEGLRVGAFVPSAKLDSPLVPMSAPDTSQLKGLFFSGQPIRLRILVTATGHVAEVLVLQAAPQDEEAVTHIKTMFLDTAYIPGQVDGKPVAAQLDMELQLGSRS
jgi:hypothetical protein